MNYKQQSLIHWRRTGPLVTDNWKLSLNFLFFIERELHISILEPIWKYIQKNRLGRIAFFSLPYRPSSDSYPGIGIRDAYIDDLTKQGLAFLLNPRKFKPDITFVADHNYQFVEGLGFIVNLGHGTISKGFYYLKKGLSRRENSCDLMCVPGNIHRNYLKHAVYKPIEVTGMPKLDKVFQKEAKVSDGLLALGLDFQKKTVLFAPTFNPELSVLPFIKRNIREYFPNTYNVIIKLHNSTPTETKIKYEEASLKQDGLYFSKGEDVSEFFPLADVLVSDFSSVIFEFSALKKPIILFDSPHRKEFALYDSNLLENENRDIGIRINDPRELPSAILKATTNPLVSVFPKQKEFISVTDGKSAEKTVLSAQRFLNTRQSLITVLLNSQDQKWIRSIKERLGNRFEIVVLTDKAGLKSTFNIKTPYLVYLEDGWDFSPNMIDYLVGHLEFDTEKKMIIPICCSKGADNQIQPVFLGIQLGYQMAGECVKTKEIHFHCVAMRVNFLNFESGRLKECLKKLAKKTPVYLALDCLIFLPEKKEALDLYFYPLKPANSLYLNLAYLEKESYSLKKVISKTKLRLKKWPVWKRVQFWVDLASMEERLCNWSAALRYLNKAKQEKIQDPIIAARVAFHHGVVWKSLGNSKKAKEYFKICLKNQPDHLKAKELLQC